MQTYYQEQQTAQQKPETKESTTRLFRARMFFHTTARNVGLFTSLSLAALAAAHSQAAKGRVVTAATLFLTAALFLGMAMDLNRTLLTNPEMTLGSGGSILPHVLFVTHVLLTIGIVAATWRAIWNVRNK